MATVALLLAFIAGGLVPMHCDGQGAAPYEAGILGAPFLAANAYLREEVDFGGIFSLQAGWAWRKRRGRLFRIGLHYANGMSNQFALHDLHEQQLGFGIWHDF